MAHGHDGVPVHLDLCYENQQADEYQGNKEKLKHETVEAKVRHRGLPMARCSRRHSECRGGRRRCLGGFGD